ncbi:hypothetical protein BC332_28703 [Capsicum chinense]|nr:hypothetical protein BC332_28703 [Capsicum chinense]
MLLKFGSKPVLVASSPEMAKEILQTHDAIFASRPALAAGKYIRKPVLLKNHLTRFTLCTINRMVISGKYHSDDESKSKVAIEQLECMLDEWFVLNHKAKAKEDSVPKDMVDVLLQLENDPNLEAKLTTNNLRD